MSTAERRERDREAHRRRRAADPEKAREYSRRYYAATRERQREQARIRRAADPEKYREQLRESYRRRRSADPEKVGEQYRERSRRRRAAVPEKVRDQTREGTRRYRTAHPEQARNGGLRRKHGLYPEDWHVLWTAQDGCCWLCGEPLPDDPAKVHIDHDHRCPSCGPKTSCRSCRRGLAHGSCNTAIGLLGEDPDKLQRIADSLAEYQRRTGRLAKPLTLFDLEET